MSYLSLTKKSISSVSLEKDTLCQGIFFVIFLFSHSRKPHYLPPMTIWGKFYMNKVNQSMLCDILRFHILVNWRWLFKFSELVHNFSCCKEKKKSPLYLCMVEGKRREGNENPPTAHNQPTNAQPVPKGLVLCVYIYIFMLTIILLVYHWSGWKRI